MFSICSEYVPLKKSLNSGVVAKISLLLVPTRFNLATGWRDFTQNSWILSMHTGRPVTWKLCSKLVSRTESMQGKPNCSLYRFNNQTFHCGLPQTLSDSHTGLVSQASIRLPCRILAMLGSLRNLDLWRVFWWQPPMLESSSQTLWFRLILNPGKKFIEIL